MTKAPHSRWIDSGRSIAKSPAAAYVSKLGKGSQRTIQQSLTTIAAMLAGDGADPMNLRWEKLTRTDTVKLRTELKEKFAAATANKMLSALRGVLRAARDMGLMKEGDFQTAASLEIIKEEPAAAATPAPFTMAVLKSLFQACASEPGASGRRDAAMLAIFLSSGLRRAEAAGLDMADYDQAKGRLHIRGERPEYDRLVQLLGPARAALADWLRVRTNEPGPLLLPVDRGGLIRFRRMTDQAVYDIFGRIVERAGVPDVTLRDLRRAYVISLIRAGHPIDQVQYLVGHASWFTTSAYSELAKDKVSPSYDLEKLPYVSPKGGTR